ncbi:phosphoenolpyruvate--protein phosphotransferase [Zooshikella sp. RANM57]|uniref:phosphoenolpyruvate--protein phosphotransferase n=1 Tax=Zooshikella sp. RANM57 TaxID=3425863 RepID=UPI003D6F9C5E
MSFLKNFFVGTRTRTPEVQQQACPKLNEETVTSEHTLCVGREQILLNQTLTSKEEALRLIAHVMQQQGLVSDDYYDALVAREQKVSTYLLNGVAIPHGVNEAKTLVQKTGVVIVQVPKGIIWNDKNEIVRLIVGIAANGSEHLSLLQKLTTVVMNADLTDLLATTHDANDVVRALGTDSPAQAPSEKVQDFAIAVEAQVVDEAGMHARPASLLSEQASVFADTEIHIRNGDKVANAKSMAALLTMGAQCGDTLVVSAQGIQAKEAVETLCQMINSGLDCDEDKQTATYRGLSGLPALTDTVSRLTFQGAAASPGIAMAELFIHPQQTTVAIKQDTLGTVDAEKESLYQACEQAKQELDALEHKLQKHAPQEAVIFKAQKQLLSDELILKDAHQLITELNSAAWSWQQAIKKQVNALNAVNDERIKARIADLYDICDRVVAKLVSSSVSVQYPATDFILLAHDLTPSQIAALDGQPILGIATELGGPNSHMAILARALGIPAIVGLGDGICQQVNNKERAIIDPQGSALIIAPNDATQQRAFELIQRWQTLLAVENEKKFESAQTLDGHRIKVVGNVAQPDEAATVTAQGGEGAGLLRTEFLFEASESEPSVDEQVAVLKNIVTDLTHHPLVVRTADIGGDKPVSWLNMATEDNPFLGVRGIRLSFKHEAMFRRQLEAIYRTAIWQQQTTQQCSLHILFPMIAKQSEWRKASDLAEQVRCQLNAPVLPLGVMIEVPSAALIAEQLAQEVDFFSIGSNDLTQYTLAMDRLHPELCHEADSYHPALLRLIEMTTSAAHKHGKWVGVCGNMASDPALAMLLVGLGVDELSVSPASVPSIKNSIRSVSYTKLQQKAQKALQLGSSEAVMALYQNHDDLV